MPQQFHVIHAVYAGTQNRDLEVCVRAPCKGEVFANQAGEPGTAADASTLPGGGRQRLKDLVALTLA